ncbi:hypothetical protein BX600DRAFT_504084 [Xylariales sp. PMI_506]|nr:hypothetical protein BX600DRAFT_504084 [Xylariales sp. PMI_506]
MQSAWPRGTVKGFKRLHLAHNLDQSIDYGIKVLDAISSQDSGWPLGLVNPRTRLSPRYQLTRSMDDLHFGIDLLNTALENKASAHHAFVAIQQNLAGLYDLDDWDKSSSPRVYDLAIRNANSQSVSLVVIQDTETVPRDPATLIDNQRIADNFGLFRLISNMNLNPGLSSDLTSTPSSVVSEYESSGVRLRGGTPMAIPSTQYY